MVLLVNFQDFLNGMFRGHCLFFDFLGYFISSFSASGIDWIFYQLISHLSWMGANIDSHSTPLGLSFNLDVSGFSALTGLELPKRYCDPVLTLDYGRLPGDALALGPSELLDDTTDGTLLSAVRISS